MQEKSQNLSLFGEPIDPSSEVMRMSLDIKKPSEFFWVRKIRGVDISKCCAECFIGESDTRLYHGTVKNQTPRKIDLDIEPNKNYIAYYLCGLSKGYKYNFNTHVAFIYRPGETLRVKSPQINLEIINAHRVDFQNMKYTPNPLGYFSKRQQICRNWIFANFIRDGKLHEYAESLPF
jgi:hypothetical protein